MTNRKIKTEIMRNGHFRSFTVYIFDPAEADKIVEFLKSDPLIRRKELVSRAKRQKSYLKIVFFTLNSDYLFRAISDTDIFDLWKNFNEPKSVKSTIDYLLKIMTPQQKIKFAYWLENIG